MAEEISDQVRQKAMLVVAEKLAKRACRKLEGQLTEEDESKILFRFFF